MPIKGIYRHFKGNYYELLGEAVHSETGERLAVYRPLKNPASLWVRPLAMWNEPVERDDYSGPRFAPAFESVRLIELWRADPERAYRLHGAFRENENGFLNNAFGLNPEQFAEYVRLKSQNALGLELKVGYVPETVYILEVEGEYVGLFNLRHRLNDFLRGSIGHIGYGIAPEYRGRGYATMGLALTVERAKRIIPEEEVYLSFHKDNPASLRVQYKNGAYIAGETELEFLTRIAI